MKKENINTQEYWDEMYRVEISRNKIRKDSYCYGFIEKYIDDCNSFLDAGCGTGSFIQHLISRGVDIQNITVIDISQKALEYIYEKFGVHYYCRSLNYPIPDFFFKRDLITCFHTLEHLENPEKVIKELYNITKKYLIFAIPLKDEHWREHLHNFTIDSVKELFKEYKNIKFMKAALKRPGTAQELLVIIKK